MKTGKIDDRPDILSISTSHLLSKHFGFIKVPTYNCGTTYVDMKKINLWSNTRHFQKTNIWLTFLEFWKTFDW